MPTVPVMPDPPAARRSLSHSLCPAYVRVVLVCENAGVRCASAVLAALFLLGAAVQVNDPDPVVWVIVYGAAAALSMAAAAGRRTPTWAPLLLGAIALVWGLALAAGVPDVSVYGQMFGAWEMASIAIEDAREASGLFLIGTWMAVLAWRGRSG